MINIVGDKGIEHISSNFEGKFMISEVELSVSDYVSYHVKMRFKGEAMVFISLNKLYFANKSTQVVSLIYFKMKLRFYTESFIRFFNLKAKQSFFWN